MTIKKPFYSDEEIPKLIERETKNYLKIKYFSIPKFYGTTKTNKYVVTEFINGENLMNIQDFHFSDEEKYSIIIQLLLVFY